MRIRIFYQKEIPLRFTSALDIQRIWERSLRRAGLQIMYSQGFHPQPKIQLGLPLPLGYISSGECVDVWLEEFHAEIELINMLNPKVPAGIIIDSIELIDDFAKPVVSTITSSEYLIKFWDEKFTEKKIQPLIDSLLEQPSILRTKRNGKQYDLRPLILDARTVSISEQDDHYSLYMKLVSEPNRMGRADEVLLVMGFSLNEFLVKRTHSS